MHNLLKFFALTFLLTSLVFTHNTYASESVDSKQALEKALAAHKGEVVYLDFWASWCVPCRKSFPWMNSIQEKYQSKGFTVIGVNLDAEHSLAKHFLTKMPASFPIIYDPKGKIAKHFSIQGMPSSMIIGRDGQIKIRHTGFFTKKIPTYEQQISQLLNQ